MTQQLEDEFERSVQNARQWMEQIQAKLKENDNTQGPRSALENRLRETEKIRDLEPDGQIYKDEVLMKAEPLLQLNDEPVKRKVVMQVKEIKNTWEETVIYITHCHSRIEWVWLHWKEYLQAQEDFEEWIIAMRQKLEPELEMQLGLKEKLWQLDQYHVLSEDIQNQTGLLDRLLEEAQSLYNRTKDPSVNTEQQDQLKSGFKDIKAKAQEKVKLLEKICKDHQKFDENVGQFQMWVNNISVELNQCSAMVGTAEPLEKRLKILEDIKSRVIQGGETLQHLEADATSVKNCTSPLGAEKITKKMEELWKQWGALVPRCVHVEETMENAYLHVQHLENELFKFRKLLQETESSLDSLQKSKTDEDVVPLLRKCTAIKSNLDAEESIVERLKAHLREFCKFSQNVHPLSATILSAIKEYESLKRRTSKMSKDLEIRLKRSIQDPLREFRVWKPEAQKFLDSTADLDNTALIFSSLQDIEFLLLQSTKLQKLLAPLQQQHSPLASVLQEKRFRLIQNELNAAVKERDILHNSLLQRKSRLQSLLCRTEDFDRAFEAFQQRLAAFQLRLSEEKEALQPNLLAKRAQLERLHLLQKDLAEFEAQIKEQSALFQSNPTHMDGLKLLLGNTQTLNKSLESVIKRYKESASQHEQFDRDYLDLWQWLMATKQKLVNLQGSGQNPYTDTADFQMLLTEFSDRTMKLHQTEVLGHTVMSTTSSDGAAHIEVELKRLRESWNAVNSLMTDATSEEESNSKLDQDGNNDNTFNRTVNWGSLIDQDGKVGNLSHKGEVDNYEMAREGRNDNSFNSTEELNSRMNQDGKKGNASIRADESHSRMDQDGKKGNSYIRTEGFNARMDQNGKNGNLFIGVDEVSSRMDQDGKNDSSFSGVIMESGSMNMIPGADRKTGFETGVSSTVETSDIVDGGTGLKIRRHLNEREALGDNKKFQREFELWLNAENNKLSGILRSSNPQNSKELEERRARLKVLRSRVPQGQKMFESLLQSQEDAQFSEDVDLEDLRYRWMLHKSKLRDAGDLSTSQPLDELPEVRKKHSGRMCSFLYRVCRAALPLQLLMLLLLLLAFLLPLAEKGQSCTLSNNFARSFKLMLRHDGPPPT
ncbi:nesprin-3 isoform X2 [Protopterus annectens]|nr:nesprin-3 isoform X2 [Protopterus annectens]